MEYSKYNIYLNNYPKQDYTLIYNLFSCEVACIRHLDIALWSESLTAKMIQKGFVVLNQQIEMKNIQDYYRKSVEDQNELVIMLILTRKCNCKCIYCYEDLQATEFPDLIDIQSIISVIMREKEKRNAKNVKIVFYGGEPLLNKAAITNVSAILHEKLQDSYSFSIITNGTLAQKNDFELWSHLGLKNVKITIDGNCESHNSRRPYKNRQGSYNDIISKLELIKDYTHIVINIVVDPSVFGIGDLIDDLRAHYIEPEFSLSLREPNNYTPEAKADLVLQNVAILSKKGAYQSTKISYDHGIICMGKNINHIVIDAQGNVYRCNANFNSKIGNMDENISKEFIMLSSTCKQCKYLPICYGGCIYEHRCEFKYFERVIPNLVKLYTCTN